MRKRVSRPRVQALDPLLGTPYPVLDDGFVRVVDYMGGDPAIIEAARFSYGNVTRRLHENRSLIRYLMRHSHTTPFEMCEIKFHVRVPMDTWRQWIRHRTANVNEYSTRYSVAIDVAQRTSPDQWRTQSATNRQAGGSHLPKSIGRSLSAAEQHLQQRAREIYVQRLHAGVAREQARKDLPLSTYTEAYWKIDLHNLLHFLQVRMDKHAQQEIRAYATTIGEKIVSVWVPLAWEAFMDYRVRSVQLSRIEIEVISAISSNEPNLARELARKYGIVKLGRDGRLKPNRERREFESKGLSLGLNLPWDS